MFLEYTEHVGFKRFKLNPIAKFIYRPKHDLTFVIGTNGAGKSSLMSQWDPSPKAANDYRPGGYCKQIIRDRGSVYELRSEFDLKGGAKHHFIKDGVPLNNGETGGTAKVQKALVEQHFNFDRELHKVLSGRTSFTQMSAKQRQQVITELSNCDMTYAFDVYSEVQSMIRNAKGTQKDLGSTVASDKQKLADFHIDKVYEERERLVAELKDLTAKLLPGVKNNVDADLNEYRELTEQLERKVVRFVLDQTDNVDNLNFTSLKALRDAIVEQEAVVAKHSQAVSVLSSKAAAAEETWERLQKMITMDDDTIEHRLIDIEKQLQSLPKPSDEFDSIKTTPSDYHVLQRDLGTFITQHGELAPLEKTDEEIAKVKLWLQNYPMNLKGMDQEIARNESWLEHIKHHDKLACPSCNHEFLPGFDEKEIPAREQTVKNLTESRVRMEESKERAMDLVAKHDHAKAQRVRLIELFQPFDELQESILENIFSEQMTLGMSLLTVQRKRERYEAQIDASAQREQLTKEQARLKDLSKTMSHNRVMEESETQRKIFESTLDSVTEEQDRMLVATERLKALKAVESQYELHRRVVNDTQELGQRIVKLSNELVRYEVNQFIENLMNDVHASLAKTQQVINDYNTLAANIRRLEEIEQEAATREEEWGLIAEALSPVNGLIADQMKDHINVLIVHMNQIIDQIWAHNLEIQPCGLTSEKLNYQFPMYVASDPDLVPDISMGSKGEREVIDFAFTVVLMLQRGLTEYPLYLDEIASSFDKAHRTRFMVYLRELVSNKKISQIFMINHYNDMYGIVGEHDVVVIDQTNVVVPERFNEEVEIS